MKAEKLLHLTLEENGYEKFLTKKSGFSQTIVEAMEQYAKDYYESKIKELNKLDTNYSSISKEDVDEQATGIIENKVFQDRLKVAIECGVGEDWCWNGEDEYRVDTFDIANAISSVTELLREYFYTSPTETHQSKQLQQADVIKSVCFSCNINQREVGTRYCISCLDIMKQTVL